MKEKIIGIILLWVICMVLSWAVTCGLVWLVCKCFSLVFSWKIATGIWIMCMIARWIVSAAKGGK